jgi:hypothetical protein
MALRRADTGRVARFEGCYYDSGRRVPCFLPDAFDELIESGLLTLAEPDPGSVGWCRVALTSTGRARFAVLSEREQQWARRPLHAEYQRTAAVDPVPVPPAVHGRTV